jgi:MULE transposase-like protein
MEPIFAASTSETVTAELRAQLDEAVADVPPAHRLHPSRDEVFESKEAAFARLQDWAFVQGFAIVKESAKSSGGQVKRLYLDCVHHKKGTRNTRKLDEVERQRHQTKTQANSCLFSVVVYHEEKLGWMIRPKNLHHNHAPSPDPFQYHQHQDRKPSAAAALALASTHRGILSYKDSAAVLEQEGYEIKKKKYWNLRRKEEHGTLTRQEELEYILQLLEDNGAHVRVRDEYVLDAAGERTVRVIKDLFWMTAEQIKLGRRFVSGFMYETDATFNTNRLKLPLSVMVGIDNRGKTFPMAYCYITSESAASFKFVADQLSDLAFYDCPEAAVVVGDFSKGLGAAMAAKAAVDLGLTEIIDKPLICPADKDEELPEAAEVVVHEGLNHGEPQRVLLQLCEWHAVAAIKRRLIAAGKYTKERRDELISIIWDWVKAPSIKELDKCRSTLLQTLDSKEAKYIQSYYQPKEYQFCRAYTQTYINLGVHSTQRSESYHFVLKARLHKNLPVSRAIQIIQDQTRRLGREYDADINQQRRTTPRLLDMTAFSAIKSKLTHYALELASAEWSATKQLADDIEDGKEEEFELDPDVGCSFGCELPIRFGLPCRHWMYASVVEECPLPLSLFHPRWLFDGPAVLYDRWVMGWDPEQPFPEMGPTLANRHASDRYTARGLHRAEASALAVLDKLKDLPPGMAEAFADSFTKGTESLLAQQAKKLASRKDFPPVLPEPLKEETPLLYRKGKKRAMTGEELAQEREQDALRQRRRNDKAAAASAAADLQLEAWEQEKREREDLVEAAWVADTQLQLSQLSYQDADADADEDQPDADLHQHPKSSSSEYASEDAADDEVEAPAELGSQAQPVEISSSDEISSDEISDRDGDDEPRRSGRVKRSTRALESQQWQVEHELIPAPGSKAKARALNKKRAQNTKTSQLDHEYRLE